MYDYLIREQINLLVKRGVVSPKNETKSGDILINDYWNDRIAIIWCLSDVMDMAERRSIDLTKDEGKVILKSIHHSHDEEYGVTWNTISSHLDDFESEEWIELKRAEKKDLPTLVGKFKCKKNQVKLDKRMRGLKDWDEEPAYTVYPKKE